MSGRPGEDLSAINLAAQKRFLGLAAARAPRWIVASAAAAYGFPPGRDAVAGTITEDTPLARGAKVAYTDHKQALESLLDEYATNPGLSIVRARPSNVAGPGIDPTRAAQIAGPVMFAPQTDHPLRQQLLHEEDLASAFLALLDAPAGAYNLAPDDWLTLEDAARLLGMRYLRMPAWALRGLTEVAWRTGASAFDASWLTFLEHPPIILANAKLRSLGWTPRHTTADTLRAMAARVRGA
jgi:nucleoside-diphosphate-sugar epimerase